MLAIEIWPTVCYEESVWSTNSAGCYANEYMLITCIDTAQTVLSGNQSIVLD